MQKNRALRVFCVDRERESERDRRSYIIFKLMTQPDTQSWLGEQ